jgi:hypothetical protein
MSDDHSVAPRRRTKSQHNVKRSRADEVCRSTPAFLGPHALSLLSAQSSDSGGDEAELQGPDIEETSCVGPDGKLIVVRYRGVDPSLTPGTKEYKKAKRLADNRASAARSRALARVKVGDFEVGLRRGTVLRRL